MTETQDMDAVRAFQVDPHTSVLLTCPYCDKTLWLEQDEGVDTLGHVIDAVAGHECRGFEMSPRAGARGDGLMTETPDTITRDELSEALRRLKITPEDENTFYPAVAARIFDDVRLSRESEYEPGAVYLDDCGLPLRYTVSGGWEAFGRAGEHTYDFPLRPLRKLVPEPALTGKALHSAILEELDEQSGLCRSDCIELAWAICKMIGVERP